LSCAERAIATPVVQGQLLNERLTFAIETECAHCARPIHIEIDSDLNYSVVEQDAAPLILAPRVDFGKLQDTSIIDTF
jgi:hypothetical protein